MNLDICPAKEASYIAPPVVEQEKVSDDLTEEEVEAIAALPVIAETAEIDCQTPKPVVADFGASAGPVTCEIST